MNCGKLTESIYERSVIKVVKLNYKANSILNSKENSILNYKSNSILKSKANSTENRRFYDGAVPGADCAILAGIISGQAFASGLDKNIVLRAYLAAVNHMIICCANNGKACEGKEIFSKAYANITLIVPQRLREIKVRGMIEAAAVEADKTGIPILSCNIQVLATVMEAVASCVVNVMTDDTSDNISEKRPRVCADEDIVMTKWLGLEGTAVMAAGYFDKLCERYPKDIVEEAADFYRYLSVAPEAATAVKSGAGYMQMLREGGVFGGLWQLASDNGVGLVADLKNIPVRQETIEVCEFFDINPYELLAGGSMLITAQNGGELVSSLEKQGIPAVVIGRTTKGNDRIILHGEEMRYLEPANGDAIYRLNN